MIKHFFIVCFILSFFSGCSLENNKNEDIKPEYFNTYGSPLHFFQSFSDVDDKESISLSSYKIRGAIVPHHLVSAKSIASVFSALSYQSIQNIIIISPDHFFRCKNFLCTTDGRFHTLFGILETSKDAVNSLATSKLVTKDNLLFQYEHGIYAILPFISNYLKDVQITPIVISQNINWKYKKSEQQEILNLLESLINDKTIIVISSDFSHNLSSQEAYKKDEETAKVLFTPDIENILLLSNPAQNDCPSCIFFLTKLALNNGFFNPALVSHTNSASILGDLSVSNSTSHFSILYYQNSKLSSNDPTFSGDVTLVRNIKPKLSLKLTNFWEGKGMRISNLETPLAKNCVSYKNPYIFCTTEAEFEKVQWLSTHWSLENNHMLDLDITGYNETNKIIKDNNEIPLDSVFEDTNIRIIPITLIVNPVNDAKKINLQKKYEESLEFLKQNISTKLTIVFVHIGTEFSALPNYDTKNIFKSFIDAGADAVIAHHPHIPGPIIIYKGKPIFTSLGNFVFDQNINYKTETAVLVRIRKIGDNILFETIHSS